MLKRVLVAMVVVISVTAKADVVVIDAEFVPSNAITHINLTLRNDTSTAVAKIEYEAAFVTEGRTVPWAESVNTFDVSGGIEPNETRSLRIFDIPYGLHNVEDHKVDVVIRQLTPFDIGGNVIN